MLAASQIAFLPVDLGRWDRCPGGDALVVPLWTDVRPLRGAAGLLDWRLNGRLSQLLREGRVEGATGEKLLFVTSRVPWRRVRDMDRITPERALRVLLSVAEQREEQYPGTGLNALTIIDVPPAIKAMAETVRAIERSLIR
jgi:hypothetical protein